MTLYDTVSQARAAVARFLAPSPKAEAVAREPDNRALTSGSVAWAEVSAILAQQKYNPDDLIGRKGFDVYKRMMYDEQVKSVMHFKRSTITGRDWQFELDAKDSGLSETEARKRVSVFKAMVENGYRGAFIDGLNAVMKAMWQGFSITEQNFGTFEHDKKAWWGLAELRSKPFDTFYPIVNDKGDVLRWVQKSPRGANTELDMAKFVYYRFNPDCDEHYGQSELRAAYRPFLSKDIAIRYRNIFMERLAAGFVVVTAQEGHGMTRGDANWNAMTDILKTISGKSGIIMPEGLDIEVVMPPSGQVSTFLEAIEQDDQAIARAALVPNLLGMSPGGQTGSYSQSDTQFDVFMIVSDGEASRLEDALNEQVFGPLGRVNFADGVAPRFRFKPLSKRRVQQVLDMWGKLVTGKAVQASEPDEAHLRKMLEFPEKGELLEDPAAAAPFTPLTPASHNDEGDEDERRPVGRGDESDEGRDAGKKRAMRRARFTESRPLYVRRQLTNWRDVDRWAKAQGFRTTAGSAMHATVCYSRVPLDWMKAGESHQETLQVPPGGPRVVAALGSEGAVVLHFASSALAWRHEEIKNAGASWDYENYEPHVTISYEAGDLKLADIEPYRGALEFGPEIFEDIKEDFKPKEFSKRPRSQFAISRAEVRVAFSIIERQTDVEHERHIVAIEDAFADVVAEATTRIPASEEEAGKFTLDGNKVRGIESAVRRMLKAGMDIGVDHSKREVARARKRFERIDMARLGDMAGDWLRQKSFTITGDIQAGAVKEIRNSLVRGLKFNWGHERVKEDVYKTLVKKGFLGGRAAAQALGVGDKDRLAELLEINTGLEPYRLDTVVRTNMFEAVNEARFNTFTDPVLGDFVRGFEYSAVLDGRTTEVCAHLDGKKYERERWEGDLRPWVPPNHFNCRSLLVPITAVDEEAEFEDAAPDIEPQEGFGE